jgi:outer membrane protein
MRSLKLFSLFLLILFSLSSYGQGSKIGHINSAELLKLHPKVKEAQELLEKYSQELEAQVKTLLDEYQNKLETYQEKNQDMTASVRKDKERELMQLEERIKRFQEEAQQELQEKERELVKPILDHVYEIIGQVAKEKGFDYILDTSAAAVLYNNDMNDISAEVKAKLGLN